MLAVPLFYHKILCTKFTHLSKYKVINPTLGVRMFLRTDYPQIFSIRAVDAPGRRPVPAIISVRVVS